MAPRRVTPAAYRIAPPDPGPLHPGRAAWHAARSTGIGGSDIAGILGIGYKTPYAVYQEKTGGTPEHRSRRLDEAALFGHLHEPVIADEFRRRTGLRVLPSPGILANTVNPWMLANVDRLVTPVTTGRVPPDRKYPLEIKTRSAYQADKWKDGPDDAPALQLQWYLAVTGAAYGYIAVLLGGNEFRWWKIDRDDTLIPVMIDAARDFLTRVRDGTPPEPRAADTGLLDTIWSGIAERVADLPPAEALGIAERISTLRVAAKDIAKEVAEAENQLKAMLGDAETGMTDGMELCTWRRTGPFRASAFADAEPELAATYQIMKPAIDTDRLAAEHPDIYAQYRSRVLRITGLTKGTRTGP